MNRVSPSQLLSGFSKIGSGPPIFGGNSGAPGENRTLDLILTNYGSGVLGSSDTAENRYRLPYKALVSVCAASCRCA